MPRPAGYTDPALLLCCLAPGQEEEPSGLALLSGTWRLVYSSGFASGRYGNQQPSFPGTLGQVNVSFHISMYCCFTDAFLGHVRVFVSCNAKQKQLQNAWCDYIVFGQCFQQYFVHESKVCLQQIEDLTKT